MNFADSLNELSPNAQRENLLEMNKKLVLDEYAGYAELAVKNDSTTAAKKGLSQISGGLAINGFEDPPYCYHLIVPSIDLHPDNRFFMIDRLCTTDLSLRALRSVLSDKIFDPIENYFMLPQSEIEYLCRKVSEKISALGFRNYSVTPVQQQFYMKKSWKTLIFGKPKWEAVPCGYATILKIEVSW